MLGVIQLGEIFERVINTCSEELTKEIENTGAYYFTGEEYKLMFDTMKCILESHIDDVEIALDIAKESAVIYSAIETKRKGQRIIGKNASRPAIANYINGAREK